MSYTIHLEQFDGPLDLLLHLIQKAQVDIQDIFVSEITEQYLAYMDQLDEVSMDTASEFLAMAATLLEIKSRSLLPKPKDAQIEDEADPEQELIKRLSDYQKFKELSLQLRDLEESNISTFYKLPEEFVTDQPNFELDGTTMDALQEALLRILGRIQIEERVARVREVRRESFTIQERIFHIQHKIRQNGKVLFASLFTENCTRAEVVMTFVALLELLRLNRVSVSQSKIYGDILLKAKKVSTMKV